MELLCWSPEDYELDLPSIGTQPDMKRIIDSVDVEASATGASRRELLEALDVPACKGAPVLPVVPYPPLTLQSTSKQCSWFATT
jgi:hypothetical protein